MPATSTDAFVWETLDRFESRVRRDAAADLCEYLPPPDHPAYLELLTELVRLDMEFAWGRQSPRPPEWYFARFPGLAADTDSAGAVAFEDYRLRRDAGESVSPADYQTRYRVPTNGWPDSTRNDPPSSPDTSPEDFLPPTEQTARTPRGEAVVPAGRPVDLPPPPDQVFRFPDVGDTFSGFELTDELGRGMCGRVFLARQAGLARRPVALKVGRGLFHESQTLASLQHSNIVPIYSYHQDGDFQAVCMPFFGRATLATLIRALPAGSSVPETAAHLSETVRTGRPAVRPSDPTPLPVPLPKPALDGVWSKFRDGKYVDAVVWVGSQLAAGLAHAHQQGVLHRDIKPANILLGDDGVPMLLDFNLAADLNGTDSSGSEVIGGTLPYMSPEQLRAFAGRNDKLDARTDVYALGVVLYEALTGRRPFPDRSGPVSAILSGMLADRERPIPSIRKLNPHVPASVEALIARMLTFNPVGRFPSAAAVAEDLTRHLTNRPLKHVREPSVRERAAKWVRRHPKLTSSGSVAGIAVAVLAAAGAGGFAFRERARALDARVTFADHGREVERLRTIFDDRNSTVSRIDDGVRACETALARYGIPADQPGVAPGWEGQPLVRHLNETDRAGLRNSFGELFYLMASASARKAEASEANESKQAAVSAADRWNQAAAAYSGDALSRSVRTQRADLARLGGLAGVEAMTAEANATTPSSARDRYLLGYWLFRGGKYRQALPELVAATTEDPRDFSAWFVRGVAHMKAEQPDQAAQCFTAGIALRPDFAPVWMNRGLAFARLRQLPRAVENYDVAIRLDPTRPDPHFFRAGCLADLGRHADAIAGYTAALACPDCPVRVFSYRAHSRKVAGDKPGEAADRAEAERREPTDALSWLARAESRVAANPTAALADTDRALAIDPELVDALQLKAHVLSEQLRRPADAVTVLSKAIDLYPDYVPVRAGRAVERARAGDRSGAHSDAEAALARDSRGPNLYQIGSVYALTAEIQPTDRFKAIELISAALRNGFGREDLKSDTDLNPIRGSDEFKKLLSEAVR